jgi:hypothetical protein
LSIHVGNGSRLQVFGGADLISFVASLKVSGIREDNELETAGSEGVGKALTSPKLLSRASLIL